MEHGMNMPKFRMSWRLVSLLLVFTALIALAPARGASAASYSVVNCNDYLTLRKTASTSAASVARLLNGDVVSVSSKTGSFSYVTAYATGLKGYVLSSYLVASTDDTPLKGTRYVNAQEWMTLRKTASTSAAEVARLNRGEAVTLLGRKSTFARVRDAQGRVGYLLESYLVTTKPSTPVTPPTSKTYRVYPSSSLTLRQSPNTSSKVLASLPVGSAVTLLGYDGKFARVTAGSNTGYVLAGYLRPAQTDAYLAKLGTVKVTDVYTPAQMVKDLATLQKAYPSLVKIASIGTSVQGRDIPVAIVGNRDASRHVLVQAAMHGREHMTALLVMKQLEYLLSMPEEKTDGVSNRDLLGNTCFHILPMTNPDGVTISQTAKTSAALDKIYANDKKAGLTSATITNYLRAWKANANGVDINRNFSAGWKTYKGAASPSFAFYKGKAAEDQPETAALVAYTKKYAFKAVINYHAYGSEIFWEYGSNKAVNDASKALANAVKAKTAYPLTGSIGLDSGGYKDWAMDVRGIPSLTIEVGTRDCPLPLDEFYTMWERNREVLGVVGNWVSKR